MHALESQTSWLHDHRDSYACIVASWALQLNNTHHVVPTHIGMQCDIIRSSSYNPVVKGKYYTTRRPWGVCNATDTSLNPWVQLQSRCSLVTYSQLIFNGQLPINDNWYRRRRQEHMTSGIHFFILGEYRWLVCFFPEHILHLVIWLSARDNNVEMCPVQSKKSKH